MRILIADSLPSTCVTELEATGLSVKFEPGLSGAELRETLAKLEPEIVVVRSTRIDRAMIEADRSLALIIRAGAGYNTIDVEAASERSVYVANCPGKNSIAVAELAMGLIISLDRRIPDNVIDARAGVWNKGDRPV